MGIFSLKKEKEKRKLVLVFDIGSSSVGGALFWVEKGKIPEVVLTMREEILLERNSPRPEKFFSLALKSLDILAGRIHAEGKGAPDVIFCVLSSPWHASETRIIKLSKNTPFVFTAKMADELIRREISLFEDEHFEKYTNKGHLVQPIELRNIKILLNGYEAAKPLDQKANELEMTIFISVSPEEVLKRIEKAIMRHFHPKEIKFSSFIMSSFTVARDIYPDHDNFLLVDIGGEISNISMVKRNVLKESVSFPLGHNFFIRKVAASLDCSLPEASSFISLFQNGHLEESLLSRLGPLIENLKREWLSKFEESLAGISTDISIPSVIYLTTEKNLKDFFSWIIKNEQFTQYSLTESKFKTTFFGPDTFHGLAKFDDEAARDSRLIIAALYISRVLN